MPPARPAANYGLLLEVALPLNTLRFLLESHDSLALLPVAIPRAIPMDLLAFPAAVAVRLASLASLAELAIGAVQRGAANLAALPKITQILLEVKNMLYPMIRNIFPGTRRKRQPKLGFGISLKIQAATHCAVCCVGITSLHNTF